MPNALGLELLGTQQKSCHGSVQEARHVRLRAMVRVLPIQSNKLHEGSRQMTTHRQSLHLAKNKVARKGAYWCPPPRRPPVSKKTWLLPPPAGHVSEKMVATIPADPL